MMKTTGFMYDRRRNIVPNCEVLKCYKYHIEKNPNKYALDKYTVLFDCYPEVKGVGRTLDEALYYAKLAMRKYIDTKLVSTNEKGCLIDIKKKNGLLVEKLWMSMTTKVSDIIAYQKLCKRKRRIMDIVGYMTITN